MKREQRDVRDLLRGLRALTKIVGDYLNAMDIAMEMPSTEKRGKAIAEWLNRLEYANDCQKRFTLERFKKKRPV